MAFQFSTRTMLLLTTCIAVVLASLIAWLRAVGPSSTPLGIVTEVGWIVVVVSPVWGPLVWAAYASGRRQLTVVFVVAFAVFEVLMTAISILLM